MRLSDLKVSRGERRERFLNLSAEEFLSLASESDIQKGVRDLLALCKVPHSVTDASRAFGPDGKARRSKVDEGWPDISGVLPPSGRALFIETKSRAGRLSPGQRKKIAELRSAGALVFVPRSVEDLARGLIAAGIHHQALDELLRKR